MRVRQLAVVPFVLAPGIASAGGLLLPGNGAISTSRAGAAVASASDGEALGVNPAGLAKTEGTTITVSTAIIGYYMDFTRTGAYDPIADEDRPYEGQTYQTIENNPDLPLGIGRFQPVPMVAVVSDFGGVAGGKLRGAVGLYAPNAYPFRDMTSGYVFDESTDYNVAPPPTRYDIMTQDAALVFPSIAASYRVLPELDIGARFSFGFASLKSKVAVWGSPGNYVEAVTHDAVLSADAKDNFVPTWGLGAMYRPTPTIEIGANFNWRAVVRAKGGVTSEQGPNVSFNMQPTVIGPVAQGSARCAEGGTFEEQKICVDFQLPMNFQLGARYKFLDIDGSERGDIELDVGWENWGKRCEDSAAFAGGCTSPSQYRVVVDSAAYVDRDANPNTPLTEDDIAVVLKDNYIEHRFKDTWNVRLGGSYHMPMGDYRIILRGGVGYDSRAAEDNWLRADVDGAARITTTAGATYRSEKWEATLGFGAILEGENTNGNDCNPMPSGANTQPGCANDGTERPIDDREGPDPINPIVVPEQQAESPVNKGTFNSNYILFMLGFSTWF